MTKVTDARPAAVSADELDAMDVPGRSTLTVGSVIDFRRPAVHRLPGTGSPSLLLPVAQVFNLCVFPVRIGLASSSIACAIPEGGAAGSEARAEAGETCAPRWSLRSV